MSTPMNIGEWLLRVRRERKLDLRALAARTGLDIGTISKIENGRTQATLGTVVRAGMGLGVTAHDFIHDLLGKSFSLLDGVSVTGEETIPTLQDVEAFIVCARSDKQAICVWVASSLNKLASLQSEVITLYEPEVIEKLLFGPLWQRYEVQYPQDMPTGDILDILRQNGVLILSDIRAYLRQISDRRRAFPERLDALIKGAEKEECRPEIGAVERIKMIDVLLLDQELEQDGKIVAMYWSVCLFHEATLHLFTQSSGGSASYEALSAEQEARLALVFITISRRLQRTSQFDTTWLNELRQKFEQAKSPNRLR